MSRKTIEIVTCDMCGAEIDVKDMAKMLTTQEMTSCIKRCRELRGRNVG